jgi:glycosyltransferase involved in cell wall biosynthesis
MLRPDPLFATVVPTKLYEYMAAGKAIISSVPGEAASLLEQAMAGTTIPPGDPSALASVVVQLADDPSHRQALGQNGAGWVRANANWGERAEKYVSIFDRVAHAGP